MNTSTLTPRQTFRDVLAQVAEQAKTLLPQAVNGRLESAARLVLQGDVLFCDDGSVEVGLAERRVRLRGTEHVLVLVHRYLLMHRLWHTIPRDGQSVASDERQNHPGRPTPPQRGIP
jgi:hypothetical protein